MGHLRRFFPISPCSLSPLLPVLEASATIRQEHSFTSHPYFFFLSCCPAFAGEDNLPQPFAALLIWPETLFCPRYWVKSGWSWTQPLIRCQDILQSDNKETRSTVRQFSFKSFLASVHLIREHSNCPCERSLGIQAEYSISAVQVHRSHSVRKHWQQKQLSTMASI